MTSDPTDAKVDAAFDSDAKSGLALTASSSRGLVRLCIVLAMLWFLVQAYMSFFPAAIPSVQQRAVHLGLGLALGFSMLAANASKRWRRAALLGCALASLAVEAYAFREIDIQSLQGGLYAMPDLQVALLGLAILVLITVRWIGWALPVLGVALIVMTTVGDKLPGILRMAPSQIERLLPQLYFGSEGVHGIPLDASSRYIFMFIVFGAFLAEFGASDFLIRIVGRGIARKRGGAGKMSVIASMLFGIASDSTTANVTTTGIITIPAMKRSGFNAERAAGIESAAAVGGQIMPPVMGTVAFLMVAITGIPYAQIIVAAVVPAVLYYFALYVGVDRLAVRSGIGGVAISERTDLRRSAVLLDTVEFVLPIVVLVYLLVFARWEPSEAAIWALALMIVIHLARHRNLRALQECASAAVLGAQRAVIVAVITAFVGVIIGPILITGLGLNLASGFLTLAGTSTLLILIMTMLASLILGSGLPSSATYVFLAVLMAPPLVEFGLPLMAVHMFIMYFGILSDLSPPTMATVYVASGIANSEPVRSAMFAMAFGIGGFIVPFMFVTRPEMLFISGTLVESAVSILQAAVVLVLLITAAVGFGRKPLGNMARVILAACGLAGVFPQVGLAYGAPIVGLAVLFLAGKWGASPPGISESIPIAGTRT